jgi:predicted nucleic acid-binding protein
LTNYLLDTNVVSELVRSSPNANVVAWMRATEEDRLFLSVLTFAEIRRGIERLQSGTRRERLRRWMEVELTDRFEGRILPVDRGIAEAWGIIMARAESSGARLPTMDTLFAATAASREMTLVTRNTRDFARTRVATLNPWEAVE